MGIDAQVEWVSVAPLCIRCGTHPVVPVAPVVGVFYLARLYCLDHQQLARESMNHTRSTSSRVSLSRC